MKYIKYLLLSLLILPIQVSAMQISIEKPSLETMNVEVESSDTIEALKGKIYQLDNIFLPETQKLIFNGTILEDGRTLADYNIQAGNTIKIAEIKYKVILDANSGTFTNGDTITIDEWENGMETNLERPTKEGYTFKGFYTERTGGTKLELILAESGIDADMTFYAQYTLNEETPKTLDNIYVSIIMAIISSITLIGVIIYKRIFN